MEDVFVRYKRGKVEATPAVQADSAEQPQQAVGFVISVRPEFRGTTGDLRVGQFHNVILTKTLQRVSKNAIAVSKSWPAGAKKPTIFIKLYRHE